MRATPPRSKMGSLLARQKGPNRPRDQRRHQTRQREQIGLPNQEIHYVEWKHPHRTRCSCRVHLLRLRIRQARHGSRARGIAASQAQNLPLALGGVGILWYSHRLLRRRLHDALHRGGIRDRLCRSTSQILVSSRSAARWQPLRSFCRRRCSLFSSKVKKPQRACGYRCTQTSVAFSHFFVTLAITIEPSISVAKMTNRGGARCKTSMNTGFKHTLRRHGRSLSVAIGFTFLFFALLQHSRNTVERLSSRTCPPTPTKTIGPRIAIAAPPAVT
jgi:hypothetical protein